MPRPSLRLTLTLWIVAIFVLVQLATLGIVAFFVLRTRETTADRFTLDAARILSQAERGARTPYGLLQAVDTADPLLADGGTEAVLIGRDGSLLASSDPGIDPAILNAVRAGSPSPGESALVRVPNARSGPLHVLVAAREVDGETGAGTLLVLRGLPHTADALTPLWSVLLVSIPASLVAAAVAAWYVSGLATMPLRAIYTFARRLRPENIRTPVRLRAAVEELSAIEAELNNAMRRLEAGYQSQARFIAFLSHELRTPVSVVLAEAQALLMRPDLHPPARTFAASTAEEMRRLSRLIESVLLLTRIQAGREQAVQRHIPIPQLAGELAAETQSLAAQQGVRLVLHIADGASDAEAIGDPNLILIGLSNVVRNAIRFSPQDGAVEVRAAADDGRISITVRDHGPGIPADMLPSLFDPLVQAETEQKRGRGTGLGLAIAAAALRLQAAKIAVTNPEDGGALFEITLPRARQSGRTRADSRA